MKTYKSPTWGTLKSMYINFDAIAPKEVIVTYKPNSDEVTYYVQPAYGEYFKAIAFSPNEMRIFQKAPDVLKVIVNTSGSTTYDYKEYTINPSQLEIPKNWMEDVKFFFHDV